MARFLTNVRRYLHSCHSLLHSLGSRRKRIQEVEYQRIFMQEIRRIRSEYGRMLYADSHGVVRRGIFAGLKLSAQTSWGHDMANMLLGAYEQEVQGILQRADVKRYDWFIDVGCANGYYAVGLALLSPSIHVAAYDISMRAQDVTRATGELNGVTDRLGVSGRCGASEMEACLNNAARPLVMLDIEGGERELVDPAAIPAFSRADLIVECHDRGRGDITRMLTDRLKSTHRIEVIPREGRNPAAYPELADLPDLQSALILCEMRIRSSHWLWCQKQ